MPLKGKYHHFSIKRSLNYKQTLAINCLEDNDNSLVTSEPTVTKRDARGKKKGTGKKVVTKKKSPTEKKTSRKKKVAKN